MHGIREVIHIRRNPYNISRPQGDRYLLPSVWNSLLSHGPNDNGSSDECGRGCAPVRQGSFHGRSHVREGQGGVGAGDPKAGFDPYSTNSCHLDEVH